MCIKIGLELKCLEGEQNFPVYKSGTQIPVCKKIRSEFQCLEG